MGFHLGLDQGQHGVAAAEGECADLKKCPEKLQIDHDSALLKEMVDARKPAAAQRISTRSTLTFRMAARMKEPAAMA